MRIILALILLAAPLLAADTVLVFEPSQTQIHWTLDSLVHTVHGTFQLKSGTVHFDPATGKAGGQLIVDARSGASGSDARDSRMHKSIIESPKFPDIVFLPDRVEGSVPAEGSASLKIHGTFRLHGSDHEMVMPVQLTVHPGQIDAASTFEVPYISWGLKNPSTLFLRVNDKVQIELHASAHVSIAATN